MLKNYLRTGLRNFLKHKVYSAINVISLCLAMTCCLLVYLYVESEMNYDRFNARAESIYRLNTHYENHEGDWVMGGSTAPVSALELAANFEEFTTYTRLNWGAALMRVNEENFDQFFTYADPAIFDMFSFPMVYGEYKSLFSDPNSLIISAECAQKWFNTQDAVGKVVDMEFNGEFVPMTIKGVVQNIPANSSIQFDVMVPFGKYEQVFPDRLESWTDWHVSTFVLFDSKVDKKTFEEGATKLLEKINPDEAGEVEFVLQPLTDIHFNEDVRRGNGLTKGGKISTSVTLIAITFFILVIAVINFTNLAIGMALPRMREIGVRKAIGAQKSQLIAQFLGETFMYSLMAFALAILCTDLLLPLFSTYTKTTLDLWHQFSMGIVYFGVGLVILITVLAGSYPAFVIGRFKTIDSLRGKQKTAGNGSITKVLVVVQFAFAILFTIGVGVMNQQLDHFYTIDKGYNEKNLVAISAFRLDGASVMQQLRSQLQGHHAIEFVSGCVGGGNRTIINLNEVDHMIRHDRIDYAYLSAMQIDVITGRSFDPERPADETGAVMVNEAFLDLLGVNAIEAIGKRIPFEYFENMVEPEIIGVVGNYNFDALYSEITPQILYVNSGKSIGEIVIKIRDGQLARGLDAVQTAWSKIFPDRPIDYDLIAQRNRQHYREQENQRAVITASGIVSILLSCLGLFALSSLYIQQRTKEVGIRKVMGASMGRLLMALSKNFALLILMAMLISFPVGWYLSEKWLNTFAYRTAVQPGIFIISGLLIVAFCYISIGYQTIKTARTNPIDSLRDE